MRHAIKKVFSVYGTETKDMKDAEVDDSMLLHAAKLYMDKHGELPPSWSEYMQGRLEEESE